jgi:hypothetical protein
MSRTETRSIADLAFGTGQAGPSGYCTLIAADAFAQIGQYTGPRGQTVIGARAAGDS